MTDIIKPNCPFCESDKVIKHGKTLTGNPRFRCRDCKKTWVAEKAENFRPEVTDIAEAYLNGMTFRELVDVYHSSPLRINQKIRTFLEECPQWGDYLDYVVKPGKIKVVALLGKSFACACKDADKNSMHIAFAIDVLSGVVLAYAVQSNDNSTLWEMLLRDLKMRKFDVESFLSNGTTKITNAISEIFPKSTLKINYEKAYRENEIGCCLNKITQETKLLEDAITVLDSVENTNLSKLVREKFDMSLEQIVEELHDDFINRLKDKFDDKVNPKQDSFSKAFQKRFEKFHMIKENPRPLVNGWIALAMQKRLNNGFSRLALYAQNPYASSFTDFVTMSKPVALNLDKNSPLLKSLIVEISARALQLPVVFSKCEMKLEKCNYLASI